MAEITKPDARTLLDRQKAHHPVVRRCSARDRMAKLRRLQKAILERSEAIQEALHADFSKPAWESCVTETFSVLEEIRFAIGHLKKWMKPRRIFSSLDFCLIRSYIWYEPRGVVLLIGPWNYPFALTMSPLVAAIAAGNSVVIKPSEMTPHTSRLIGELLADVFESDEVAVVEGGVDTSTALLAQPFDHFFFTGSVRVGKIVMKAAAEHLTSVSLELGGKSPTLVDETADIKNACEHIAWGKFINGGQTCVAPDYVLLDERRKDEFVAGFQAAVTRFFGATDQDRHDTPDFARIIDEANLARIDKLIKASVAEGARVEFGGQSDEAQCYLAPTLLTGVTPGMPIMQDEIFGPVMPVITYKRLEDAFAIIHQMEKPLAMYIFSTKSKNINHILKNTTAGGTVVNNTIIHAGTTAVPFGGVNQSGIGKYHGWYGFRELSNERSLIKQGPLKVVRLLFPPYGRRLQSAFMKFINRKSLIRNTKQS